MEPPPVTASGAAPNASLADDLFGDEMTDASAVPTRHEEEAITAAGASPTAQVEAAKSEQEEDEEEEVGDDLFGDDDDDDDMGQERTPVAASDDGLTAAEAAARAELEYNERSGSSREGTPQYESKEQTIADLKLANFGRPAEGKVWHGRLPNFLSLDSTPFDQATWEPPVKEEDAEMEKGEEERERGKEDLPDENVIRWRWGKNEQGEKIKQSNTRVVRWSDGSLSLQVGSELFDISATVDHSALLSATSAGGPAQPHLPTPTAPELSNFSSARQHGLTYLTARHGYTELVEAQASIHGTLSFRPTTLHSNTHRRLAGSVKNRYVKSRAIQMADVPEFDPEKVKLDKEKADADKAKKLKREQQKAAGGARRTKNARPGTRFVGSESDDDAAGEDDEDARAFDRRSQPRRGPGGPLAGAGEDDYDEDGFVVASDDEEDGRGDRGGRADSVEEADERIEREERRRKDRRKDKRHYSDSDAEDDKSDEAEDNKPVQRRRVVADSDEE